MKQIEWEEKHWSSRAQHIFASLRIIPRVLLILYGIICWKIYVWFTGLPDPTTAQTTFATGIWAAAAAWFGLYNNSGGSKS